MIHVVHFCQSAYTSSHFSNRLCLSLLFKLHSLLFVYLFIYFAFGSKWISGYHGKVHLAISFSEIKKYFYFVIFNLKFKPQYNKGKMLILLIRVTVSVSCLTWTSYYYLLSLIVIQYLMCRPLITSLQIATNYITN